MNRKILKKRISISFIIPTYNRERTIYNGIKSLLSQLSFFDKIGIRYEVLISNNHSSDNTLKRIEQATRGNKKNIKILMPDKHLPTGEHNLFFLIHKTQYEYIWPLADDDFLVPLAISSIYKIIEQKRLDFYLINSGLIDQSGKVIDSSILKTKKSYIEFDNFKDLFISVGAITLLASFSSVIFRSEHIKLVRYSNFLNISPIYSHVFLYYAALHDKRCAVISTPLSYLRKMTNSHHWNRTSERFHLPRYWFWTVGIIKHLLHIIEKYGFLEQDITRILNSDENGRYYLYSNIKVMIINQIIESIDVNTERSKFSDEDWECMEYFFSILPNPDPIFWDCILIARKIDFISDVSIIDNNTNNFPKYLVSITVMHYYKILKKERDYLSGKGRISKDNFPVAMIGNNNYSIFSISPKYFLCRNENISRLRLNTNFNLIDIKSNNSIKKYTTSSNSLSKLMGNFIEKSNQESFLVKKIRKIQKNILLNDDKGFHIKNNSLQYNGSSKLKYGDKFIFFKKIHKYSLLKKIESRKNKGYYFESDIELIFDQVAYSQEIESIILKNDIQHHQSCYDIVHYLNYGDYCLIEPSIFLFDSNDLSLLTTFFHKGIDKKYSIIRTLIEILKDNSISINPYFDSKWYSKQVDISEHQDLLIIDHPIFDFLQFGINEGYSPHPNWDEKFYLDENPDVYEASQKKKSNNFFGWCHWCKYGKNEKRISSFRLRN